jgi:hypothetical protein
MLKITDYALLVGEPILKDELLLTVKILSKGGNRKARHTEAVSPTANAETLTTNAEAQTTEALTNCGKARSLTTNVWSLTTKAETMTTKAGTLTTDAGSKCGNVLVCTANLWTVTEKVKSFATSTPGHQDFFIKSSFGVPLCLGALVAIFTAGESVFKKRRLIWQFQ